MLQCSFRLLYYICIHNSRFIVLTRSPPFRNLSTLQEHGADSVRNRPAHRL